MRVFVTGASGFIGSAIVRELLGAGHQVLGLARSDASAQALTSAGAEVHRGALDDLDSLRSGATDSDGVIHTAFIHDFSDYRGAIATDQRAIEAIGSALAGSGRPLLITSGTAGLATGRIGTENDASDPDSAGAARSIPSETAVASLASQGVRASGIRLPPSVHGDGDHGFVPALIGIAREKGVSAYIGGGQNRWGGVHRLDAAHLYRLVLEKGEADRWYHGVADEGVTTREIAEIIGRHLNLPVVSKSPEEAAEHFSWLGHFFAIDNPTSSTLTQERMNWHPTQPGLLADLDQGSYFQTYRRA